MTPDDGRFEGRAAFRVALLRAMDEATRQEAAELRWVDADFAGWPLDDAEVRAAVAAWCRPGRRLTLLALGFEALERAHPRFVAWRRMHAHVIVGRAVAVDVSEMPTLFLGAPGFGLVVAQPRRWAGRRIAHPTDWRMWNDVADALMQQSSDSFAAKLLGL